MAGVLGGGAGAKEGAGAKVGAGAGVDAEPGSLGVSMNAVSTDPVSSAASHGLLTSFTRGCENFSWNFICG